MAEMNKHAWHRLHLVTCLAMVIVAIGFGLTSYFHVSPKTDIEAWPILATMSSRQDGAFFLVVIIDVLVAGMLIAGTAAFFERWLRNPSRARFRLQSLFPTSDQRVHASGPMLP